VSQTLPQNILLLGVGMTAQALADFYSVSGDAVQIFGTTRSAANMSRPGVRMILEDYTEDAAHQIEAAAKGACVLVSYPPDKEQAGSANISASYISASYISASDSRYGPLLNKASKIVYISSTGVYEGVTGVVDEQTPLASSLSQSAIIRQAAENFWRQRGAVVLRAPGLYGPASGLHKRLLSGSYKLPGDGQNFVSRIYLPDLARLIDAAFKRAEPGKLYLAGDEKPSTHLEVASWLCQKLGLPMPASAPLDTVAPTLRGNRQIDASLIRRELDVTLKFPTYVEGFSDALARL
jgi:nucleoside-diphosphate-sugar epimerase